MARKFEDEELMDLLRQGKTQSECARILGVGEAAISKRKKRIDMAVSRDIGLFSARRIVENHISINDINEGIKRQAAQVLEMINTVMNGEHLGQDYWLAKQRLARLIPAKGGIGNLMTAQQSELRKVAEFELNIQDKMFNIRKVEEFQRVVLETIEEADPEVARRIKLKLVEMNAVRDVLDYDGRSREALAAH